MSRDTIFLEIAAERREQDAGHGGPGRDDLHSPACWVAICVRHLGLAVGDEARVDPTRWRRQMVRVAAVAVAALESHDRTHQAFVPGAVTRGSGA